jgi:hypothetical protein
VGGTLGFFARKAADSGVGAMVMDGNGAEGTTGECALGGKWIESQLVNVMRLRLDLQPRTTW